MSLLLVVQPSIDVLLHLILRMAVAGLDLALELVAVAVDLGEIVIGELTPLLFDLAAELLDPAYVLARAVGLVALLRDDALKPEFERGRQQLLGIIEGL